MVGAVRRAPEAVLKSTYCTVQYVSTPEYQYEISTRSQTDTKSTQTDTRSQTVMKQTSRISVLYIDLCGVARHTCCTYTHAWPGTAGATRSTWGSRECSLSTPGGGRIGSTRGRQRAGGTPLGGGSEDGAGALLPWRPGGERDGGAVSRRSLTYVCSFPAVCSRLFDRVSVSVDLVSVCDRVEITINIHARIVSERTHARRRQTRVRLHRICAHTQWRVAVYSLAFALCRSRNRRR